MIVFNQSQSSKIDYFDINKKTVWTVIWIPKIIIDFLAIKKSLWITVSSEMFWKMSINDLLWLAMILVDLPCKKLGSHSQIDSRQTLSNYGFYQKQKFDSTDKKVWGYCILNFIYCKIRPACANLTRCSC